MRKKLMLSQVERWNCNKQKMAALIMVCSAFYALHASATQADNKIRTMTMPNTQKAKNDTKPNPFDLQIPFTADELTEKLLKVLDSPEGFISKDQVETIFNMSLPELDKSNRIDPADKSKIFSVKRGVNWYYDLGVGENSLDNSYFYFGWGQAPGSKPVAAPDAPDKFCIDPPKFMKKNRTTRLDT